MVYYLFAFIFVSGSRCLPYHNKLKTCDALYLVELIQRLKGSQRIDI